MKKCAEGDQKGTEEEYPTGCLNESFATACEASYQVGQNQEKLKIDRNPLILGRASKVSLQCLRGCQK